MDFACPKCRSDRTQKLSILVDTGTINTSSDGLMTFFSDDGLGFGFSSSEASSLSKLAEKYPEPERKWTIRRFITFSILSILLWLFFGRVGFILGMVLAFITSWRAYRFNHMVLPNEHAEWDAKYICLRCAKLFALASAS